MTFAENPILKKFDDCFDHFGHIQILFHIQNDQLLGSEAWRMCAERQGASVRVSECGLRQGLLEE